MENDSSSWQCYLNAALCEIYNDKKLQLGDSLLGDWERVPSLLPHLLAKIFLISSISKELSPVDYSQPNFPSLPTKMKSPLLLNKYFQVITQSKCHLQLQPLLLYHFCFNFILFHTLDTQVIINVALIDVQYSQNDVISFEKGKGSNCQNDSSSGSHHQVKKFSLLQQNF